MFLVRYFFVFISILHYTVAEPMTGCETLSYYENMLPNLAADKQARVLQSMTRTLLCGKFEIPRDIELPQPSLGMHGRTKVFIRHPHREVQDFGCVLEPRPQDYATVQQASLAVRLLVLSAAQRINMTADFKEAEHAYRAYPQWVRHIQILKSMYDLIGRIRDGDSSIPVQQACRVFNIDKIAINARNSEFFWGSKVLALSERSGSFFDFVHSLQRTFKPIPVEPEEKERKSVHVFPSSHPKVSPLCDKLDTAMQSLDYLQIIESVNALRKALEYHGLLAPSARNNAPEKKGNIYFATFFAHEKLMRFPSIIRDDHLVDQSVDTSLWMFGPELIIGEKDPFPEGIYAKIQRLRGFSKKIRYATISLEKTDLQNALGALYHYLLTRNHSSRITYNRWAKQRITMSQPMTMTMTIDRHKTSIHHLAHDLLVDIASFVTQRSSDHFLIQTVLADPRTRIIECHVLDQIYVFDILNKIMAHPRQQFILNFPKGLEMDIQQARLIMHALKKKKLFQIETANLAIKINGPWDNESESVCQDVIAAVCKQDLPETFPLLCSEPMPHLVLLAAANKFTQLRLGSIDLDLARGIDPALYQKILRDAEKVRVSGFVENKDRLSHFLELLPECRALRELTLCFAGQRLPEFLDNHFQALVKNIPMEIEILNLERGEIHSSFAALKAAKEALLRRLKLSVILSPELITDNAVDKPIDSSANDSIEAVKKEMDQINRQHNLDLFLLKNFYFNQARMLVSVRLPSGATILVDINGTYTIRYIARVIFQKKSIPVDHQLFHFNGVLLESDRSFSDYNIVNNSMLRLTLRTPGKDKEPSSSTVASRD